MEDSRSGWPWSTSQVCECGVPRSCSFQVESVGVFTVLSASCFLCFRKEKSIAARGSIQRQVLEEGILTVRRGSRVLTQQRHPIFIGWERLEAPAG
jgi:hypothetical protein